MWKHILSNLSDMNKRSTLDQLDSETSMQFDLRALLPTLIPKAIAWASENSQDIAKNGRPLTDNELNVARSVGVARPELIRVKMVPSLPLPTDPMLRQAAILTGLIGPNMIGMTLGHSIFICDGKYDLRIFSHECRHVYQYEQAGSIEAFLPTYLQQIVDVGYDNAPLEKDARLYEKRGF
jgi:hypothetical protein